MSSGERLTSQLEAEMRASDAAYPDAVLNENLRGPTLHRRILLAEVRALRADLARERNAGRGDAIRIAELEGTLAVERDNSMIEQRRITGLCADLARVTAERDAIIASAQPILDGSMWGSDVQLLRNAIAKVKP
jgi:hypothetical protein